MNDLFFSPHTGWDLPTCAARTQAAIQNFQAFEQKGGPGKAAASSSTHRVQRRRGVISRPLSPIDIVHPRFIEDCVACGAFLEMAPKYMIFATQKTRRSFSTLVDTFGDSFRDATSASELQAVRTCFLFSLSFLCLPPLTTTTTPVLIPTSCHPLLSNPPLGGRDSPCMEYLFSEHQHG